MYLIFLILTHSHEGGLLEHAISCFIVFFAYVY